MIRAPKVRLIGESGEQLGIKESDESLAIRERGGEQSTKSLDELRDYLATLRS